MDITLSIIICTCNRAEHLQQTLKAIGNICVPLGLSAELLVVDNASTDSTAEVVQTFHLPNMLLRYVYEPHPGKGNAYNRGMAEAGGHFFLFTDDDVRPPKDWIEGMCAPLLRRNADAVAGGVKIAPDLQRDWMKPIHLSMLASSDWYDGAGRMLELIGANMAFSRTVLERVPAFDTELGPGALGFGDDTLFSMQLRRAGFKIILALDIPVEHHFDPQRLLRPSFIQTAKKLGRTQAYIEHHWEYPTRPYTSRYLTRKLTQTLVVLQLKRALQSAECRRIEGAPLWELELVQRISFFKQMFIEGKRTPNYTRFGLTKREAALRQP